MNPRSIPLYSKLSVKTKKIISQKQANMPIWVFTFQLLLGLFHLDPFRGFEILYNELREEVLTLFVIQIRVS